MPTWERLLREPQGEPDAGRGVVERRASNRRHERLGKARRRGPDDRQAAGKQGAELGHGVWYESSRAASPATVSLRAAVTNRSMTGPSFTGNRPKGHRLDPEHGA
jgi:hypothetical protein